MNKHNFSSSNENSSEISSSGSEGILKTPKTQENTKKSFGSG